MKKAARRLAGALAGRAVGADALARWARARGYRGLALNYHVMHAASMEAHVAILESLFEIVGADELLARARAPERRGGRMPIALTFDDGKRSHLTEVVPVLERRGVGATFFVTSEPSRTGGLHWFDLARRIEKARRDREAAGARQEASGRDAPGCDLSSFNIRRALKRTDAAHRDEALAAMAAELGIETAPRDDDERPLTPAEVGEMARRGFTIGSHSATHPILTEETPERVRREIEDSRTAIAAWIGEPVRHFAYPNGNASDATEALTRGAGYDAAWTTLQLWIGAGENEHRLPRVQIFERYDRGEIALKAVLSTMPVLPNADGTGYAYRDSRSGRPC
jgi:peptidoglycan/xylan/chitin deacetylase (PgdA/CDA1 family)